MRRFVLLLGVAIAAVLAAIVIVKGNGKDPAEGRADGTGTEAGLYVNDVEIPCKLVFREDYAELPILAILKGLGYSVTYTDESMAEVDVDGKSYVVDLACASITEKEDSCQQNLIIPTPGESFFYCEARDGDIFVDQQTLRSVFMFMDVPGGVHVDFSNERAGVYKRTRVD